MKRSLLTFLIILLFKFNFAQISGFWGVSGNGGENDGTIFKTDLNGNSASAVYNFSDTLNYYAGNGLIDLLSYGSGKIYGLAGGGKYNTGVLFEYDSNTGAYIKRFDFDVNSGYYPLSIVKGNDNNIYGITTTGGTGNGGTVFQFNPISNIFTKKFDFVAAQACIPSGNLVKTSNGKIYGTTKMVNSTYNAKVFEYDPSSSTCTILNSITNATNLRYPEGITLYNDTALIGVTSGSFSSSSTAFLYRYNIATNSFSSVYTFSALNVQNAKTPLVSFDNINFYGASEGGGSFSKGTLYKYDLVNNIATIKISFNGSGNGEVPKKLVHASNGAIYGGTDQGGTALGGILFKYVPTTAVFTKLREFGNNTENSSKKLIETASGKIMGGTDLGEIGKGRVYQLDTLTNLYQKLFDFGASSGSTPMAGLTQGANGLFYGVTYPITGRTGVIFEFNPYTTKYTKKIELADHDLKNTWSSLTLTPSGSFYGTAISGGSNNNGALYEYFPSTNSLVIRHHFSVATTGSAPSGELTLAANNKYYGLTDNGNLYEFDPVTYVVTVKSVIGGNPYGKLCLAGNNKLYGITTAGGANGVGVLFEYDPITEIFTKKVDFIVASKGSFPQCSLVQSSAGLLYGTTRSGGANSRGVIYEYNYLTNVFTVKYNFTSAIVGTTYTQGSLLKAANGKIYGMTVDVISTINSRILYEFNTGTSALTTKANFTGNIGLNLLHPRLIEIPAAQKPAYTYFGKDTFNVCDGNSLKLRLNSTNTLTYKWYHNNALDPLQTSDSLWFSPIMPADTGSWYCKLYNAADSNITPTVFIRIAPIPVMVINASSSNICQGYSATLTASAADSYLWSNGDTTQSITVTNSLNYSVTGTNSYGCSANSAPVSLIVNPAYSVNDPQMICPGGSYSFNGHTYSSAGNYNDTLQTIFGCDSIIVTQLSLFIVNPPAINASGLTTFCQGDSVILTSDIASSYLWSNGEITQSIIVSDSGSFSVNVIDGNGCSAGSSVLVVSVNPFPSAPLITVSGFILTSNYVFGNQWYLDGIFIPGATSQNYTATSNGVYTVVVTENGCSSDASLPVTISTVGIEESSDPFALKLYPNPGEGLFNLSFNAIIKSDYKIIVYNALGQLIFENELQSFSGIYNGIIDLTDHAKGIYSIHLVNSEQTIVKKVMLD